MRAVTKKMTGEASDRYRSLDEAMELLQAAHRTMEDSARVMLAQRGLGRAHQRILYLIARSPGQSVSDMLERLQVTKQALNTPLNQLKRKGLVRAKRQPGNGRRKQLFLTQAGEAFETQLSMQHRTRLAAAFRSVGLPGEKRWRDAMKQLAGGNQPWAPLRGVPRTANLQEWTRRASAVG
jgi:DNA-binding MarR family transcriptional regulator